MKKRERIPTDIYGPFKRHPIKLEFDPDEHMTSQEFKDVTDINKIVARFETTGQLPPNLKGEGQYLDCSVLGGDPLEIANRYQEVMARLQEAEDEAATRIAAEELERMKQVAAGHPGLDSEGGNLQSEQVTPPQVSPSPPNGGSD